VRIEYCKYCGECKYSTRGDWTRCEVEESFKKKSAMYGLLWAGTYYGPRPSEGGNERWSGHRDEKNKYHTSFNP